MVLNPETTDMNMDAILKCKNCGHEDTYQVTSTYHEEQRRDGFVR
jgi:hypothetical protein